MPVQTDIRLTDGDHVVQFYRGEDDLVGAVAGYLSGAVLEGESVIVIATPEHREAFAAALVAAGVDVEAAGRDRRLVVLDAAETLDRFMADGRPDPVAFDSVVGGLVRSTAGGGQPVRAYGEMVALLWDAGNVTAAIELETLWNDLGARTPFSLFCAYPADVMAGVDAADDFASVCHVHSTVVAGAPEPEAMEVTRRFPPTLVSSRLARQFVNEILAAWSLQELIDDSALVVAELTANAVRHADSDVTVGVARVRGGIRLEIGDASTAVPVRRRQGSSRLDGRGLLLVDKVATAWGHRVVPGGKLVWVELAADASR